MGNGYYDKPVDLAPFTTARAEDVNARIAGLVGGFDKMPYPHATLPGFSGAVAVGPPTDADHAVSAGAAMGGGLSFAADIGVANAHVVNLAIAPAAYVEGLTVTFKALNANTGPATININGLGIKQLTRSNGVALVAGDIAAGQITSVIYNGVKFLGMAAFQGQFDELTGVCQGYADAAEIDAATALAQAGIATTQAGIAAAHASTAVAKSDLTAADRVQTGLDRVQTGLDRVAVTDALAPAAFLTSIKTVDGADSGLDADLLDGQQGSYYLASSAVSAWAKAGTKPAYTKSEVGLANVDNTADTAKPVSTAQQTALDLKASLALLDSAFIGSLTAEGYQRFKSGIVIQWGYVTCPAAPGTPTPAIFPLAFTLLFVVALGGLYNSTTNAAAWTSNRTTTGCDIRGAAASQVVNWVAIGSITPA